ncbi:MAG: J domain-containing protein [Pseudomonadota bacterium]
MTPQSYPLAWPSFRKRTHASRRRNGQFKHGNRHITVSAAADRLEDEVDRLGGANLVISSNVQPTLSGRPRSGQGRPDDPGVAVYFSLKGDPITLACDTFSDLAQNIAGLAAHIEAVRKIERYGVQEAKETLQAFAALPAPTASARPWWEVLGVSQSASKEVITKAYRAKAKTAHSDAGGSDAAMATLNRARDEGLQAA